MGVASNMFPQLQSRSRNNHHFPHKLRTKLNFQKNNFERAHARFPNLSNKHLPGGHLDLLRVLAVRVGYGLPLDAVHLGHLEVHLPGDQLALPPRHRLARLVSRPDLIF